MPKDISFDSGNKEPTVGLETGEKPRKCVVIKKRKVSDDVEKIEMRYVAYNKIEKGSKSTTLEVISEATSYLREQANQLNYEEVPSSKSTIKSGSVVESKEHRKLKLCLPVLISIRTRFEEIELNKSLDKHKRKQAGALRSLCDEILAEASYILQNAHPISADFMKKIHNINNLSRKVLSGSESSSGLETLNADLKECATSKSKTSDEVKKKNS